MHGAGARNPGLPSGEDEGRGGDGMSERRFEWGGLGADRGDYVIAYALPER